MSSANTVKTILLVGATGLVGQEVLRQALADPRVEKIVAPTRTPLAEHAKLVNPFIDYEYLAAHHDWWQCDAVICTLGTTRKKAGSKAKFFRVDHGYPLLVAKLAQQHGAHTYVLNSAMGANAHSWIFYNKVKGQLEQSLSELNFSSLTFVRPGLIAGEREEFRLAEKVGLYILELLEPILPTSWRVNPAEHIAQALLEAALVAEYGVHSVNSAQLAND